AALTVWSSGLIAVAVVHRGARAQMLLMTLRRWGRPVMSTAAATQCRPLSVTLVPRSASRRKIGTIERPSTAAASGTHTRRGCTARRSTNAHTAQAADPATMVARTTSIRVISRGPIGVPITYSTLAILPAHQARPVIAVAV